MNKLNKILLILILIFGFGGFVIAEDLGALRVITVPQGGTGAATFTSGECLVGNGTGALTTIACGGATSTTHWDIVDDNIQNKTGTTSDVRVVGTLQASGTAMFLEVNANSVTTTDRLLVGGLATFTNGYLSNASSTQIGNWRVDGNATTTGSHVIQGDMTLASGASVNDIVTTITFPGDDLTLVTEAGLTEYIDIVTGGLNFDFFLTDTDSDINVGETPDYLLMQDMETGEAESNISLASLNAGADQQLYNWATATSTPEFTVLRQGIYNLHAHLQKTGGASKVITAYWTLSKRTDGVETLLLTSEDTGIITTVKSSFDTHAVLSTDVDLTAGDRLVLKVFADITGGGATAGVTTYMEGTTDSHLTIQTLSSSFSELFVPRNGSKQMTANWDYGNFDLTDISDLTASTTVVINATTTNHFEADATLYVKDSMVGIGTQTPNAKLSTGNTVGTKLLIYDGGMTGVGGNGIFSGLTQDAPTANGISLVARHTSGSIIFGKYTNADDVTNVTSWGGFSSSGLLTSINGFAGSTVSTTGGISSSGGAMSANTTITAGGDFVSTGGNFRFENNKFIYQKDTGGSSVPILGISTDDKTYLLSTAGGDIVIKPENSIDAMTIKATTGNVGIGTTAPGLFTGLGGVGATYLTVTNPTNLGVVEVARDKNDNDSMIGIFQVTNINNADGANADADGKGIAAISSHMETTDTNLHDDSGGNLRFYTKAEATAWGERMRITGAGNIGIGTSTPASLLTVDGTFAVGTNGNEFTVNASGNVTSAEIAATGDITASTNGSSLASPRIFGYTDLSSAEAARFEFGDEHNGLQNAFASDVGLHSYWGLVLRGGRQNFNSGFTAPTFQKTTDTGVLVWADNFIGHDPAGAYEITTMAVKATTTALEGAQWTNLFELREPDNDVLSLFDWRGYLSINSPATTTYPLSVNGDSFFDGNATTTGSVNIDGDLQVDGTINGADYCFANDFCITEGFKLGKKYKALVFLDENKNEIFEITKDGVEIKQQTKRKTNYIYFLGLLGLLGLIPRKKR